MPSVEACPKCRRGLLTIVNPCGSNIEEWHCSKCPETFIFDEGLYVTAEGEKYEQYFAFQMEV